MQNNKSKLYKKKKQKCYMRILADGPLVDESDAASRKGLL